MLQIGMTVKVLPDAEYGGKYTGCVGVVKRLRHRPFKPGTRVRPPYTLPLAGLVEWQTQRIQNPPPLAYGFKSHTRHHLGTLNSCYGF